MPRRTDEFGVERLPVEIHGIPTAWRVANVGNALTETAIWTPPVGKRIRLLGAIFSSSASGTFFIRAGMGGQTVMLFNTSGTQPVVLDLRHGLVLSPDTPLTVQSTVAVGFLATLWGVEE
jgi:hypothetical protein